MLNKKKWFKKFKVLLQIKGVKPYDKNIMINWSLADKSYKVLTPTESVDQCINFMFGNNNGINFL